eukprot:PhF_6_TR44106/c2_g1_i6/m.67244
MNTMFELSFAVHITQLDLFSSHDDNDDVGYYADYMSAAVSNAGLSVLFLVCGVTFVGLATRWRQSSSDNEMGRKISVFGLDIRRVLATAARYTYPSVLFFVHEYFDTSALPSVILVMMNTTTATYWLWSVLFVVPVWMCRIVFLIWCSRNITRYCHYDHIKNKWEPRSSVLATTFHSCFGAVFVDVKPNRLWACLASDMYILGFALVSGYIPKSRYECQVLQSLSIAVGGLYFVALCTLPYVNVWRSRFMCLSQAVVVSAMVVTCVRWNHEDDLQLEVASDVLVLLCSLFELAAIGVPTLTAMFEFSKR